MSAEGEREEARGPVLALDIGGTQVRAALVSGATVLLSAARGWPDQTSPEAEVGFVADLAGGLLRQSAAGPVSRAGVALAALTDRQGQVVLWPNRPAWRGLPFRALLQQMLGLPVAVADDANAAALAEWRFGAGRSYRHGLVAMVGTGVGAGLILDGALFQGGHGWAGELGHMVMLADGPLCGCGRRGCLQALASGRALEQHARALGLPDVASLDAAAAQGDAAASEAIQRSGRWLGLAFANLVNLLDLEAIIVGGGLSALGPLWWAALRDTLDAGVLNPDQRSVALRKAVLPDTAGLIGAAALAEAVCSEHRGEGLGEGEDLPKIPNPPIFG
jgi:glucokinase